MDNGERSNGQRAFLDVHEVAMRYGVAPPTIWAWLRNGLFPEPVRFTPSCSRWSIETLHEFEASLDEQRVPRKVWEQQFRHARQTNRRRTK